MKNVSEINTNNVVGGLYVHLLQPNKKITEPGKVIEANTSVIKHGKFNGKLSDRIKQYASSKYWHFEDGGAAFNEVTTRSYLIFDATNLCEDDKWLICGLEEKLGQLINKSFTILSKVGKGKSEYREIEFTHFDEYDSIMQTISKEINDIAKTFLK